MIPTNSYVDNLSFEVALRKVYHFHEGLMYLLVEVSYNKVLLVCWYASAAYTTCTP